MDFGNLKNLSNQAMVGASAGWVAPGEARTVLSGIPEVAGYLGRMDEAHAGLLRCQVTGETSSADARLKAMSDQAIALDTRHDLLVRGIDAVVEGNLLLLSAGGRPVGTLEALRQRLFPDGMKMVNRTYLEEAGEVEMARQRLGADDRALLSEIPIVEGHLEEAVERWMSTGAELGELERERVRAAEAEAADKGVSRADVVAARNRWIRVVRAILAGLELAEGLDESALSIILQPLRDAAAKAALKNKTQPSPEPAPAE
jgi:hypothetical protein